MIRPADLARALLIRALAEEDELTAVLAFVRARRVCRGEQKQQQDLTYIPVTDAIELLDVDPTGPVTGATRVMRGGSYATQAYTLRTSTRVIVDPATRYDDGGFRCARSLP